MSQEATASGDEIGSKQMTKCSNSPADECDTSSDVKSSEGSCSGSTSSSGKNSPVENGVPPGDDSSSGMVPPTGSGDKKSSRSRDKENKPTSVRKSNRIRVSGAGSTNENTLSEIETLFSQHGNVSKVEPHNYVEGTIVVCMTSIEEANTAVEALQGAEFGSNGAKLKLNNDFAGRMRNANHQGGSGRGGVHDRGPHGNMGPPMGGGGPGGAPRENYPVRILVNSDLVGAVIGKGGETIRDITNRTKARVDVKREVVQRSQNNKKQVHSQIVFVYGAPEAASDAVKEILGICLREAQEKSKEEPDLGLLAEDRFCGRIIGKDGKNLNNIREKSATVIQLSNSPTITTLDPQTFSLDRIITVKGALDGMCQAETQLSQKLRTCHQLEMQHYQQYGPPGIYMQPGYPGAPMMPGGFGPGRGMPYGGPPAYPPGPGMHPGAAMNGMMPGGPHGHPHPHPPPGPGGMQPGAGPEKIDEALYMRIPHVSAGAVIGTDGASIKKIMEETKTYVNVSKVNIEPKGKGDGKPEQPQRLVTIKGPPNNQCRAQWQIFQRVKSSSRQGEMDIPISDKEIKLWTVLKVPRKIVGRIIGKHGKVVRHIQANTGTIIHLPEDLDTTDTEQAVEIFGNFDNTQLALARVRALLSQIQGMGGGPHLGGLPGGGGPHPGMPPMYGGGGGGYMNRGGGGRGGRPHMDSMVD